MATQFSGDRQIKDGTIALADLSATGTPSSINFLRGDNTWSTPAGGTGFTWSAKTVDGSFVAGQGVLANKGTLLTYTLPATATVGDQIAIAGMNAGLWKIAQNASGIIHFGNQNTTTGTGGSLASVLTYDAVYLVCVVANNEWVVIDSQGNITLV